MAQYSSRLIDVDIVRGVAILGVVLFHIVWDLEFTGLISGFAFHPLWLAFGRILAGTFMFLVGVSLVLAHAQGFRKRAYLKRLLVVTLCALSISIVTWFAFPNSFIYYGILHAIAIASLVALVFLKSPVFITLIVGVGALLLPQFFSYQIFDTRWLAWIGFFENAPPSNDFVPLFPWVGLSILGVGFARILNLPSRNSGVSLEFSTNIFARFFAWAGKKSLSIYLIHQPALLAVIIPVSWLLVG